jgi:hypothetical protein
MAIKKIAPEKQENKKWKLSIKGIQNSIISSMTFLEDPSAFSPSSVECTNLHPGWMCLKPIMM